MKSLTRFVLSFIICFMCITSSLMMNLPDHISTTFNGNFKSYQDATDWLYKYEERSCDPERVEDIIPEGRQKYLLFHYQFELFKNDFVSKMKYAAKAEMIYAIYETCLLDVNVLKKAIENILNYKDKYFLRCHQEILFKKEAKEFYEAVIEIILNELCSRITYQAIYISDEGCHNNTLLSRSKCEIYIEKQNRRKYTNHMTGLLIYALNDYFPSATCSDIFKRRNCYVEAVKDCKFSTQYAIYNLWSLSRNDPLCTTELRESIGEVTQKTPEDL